MSWVEVVDSPDGTFEGTPTAQRRRFKVYGVAYGSIGNPSTIIDSRGIALPSVGSKHPSFPSLFLDQYVARQNGVVIELEALYSSDQRFRNRVTTPQPQIGDEPLWEESHRRVTVKLPYAKKQVVSVPEGSESYGTINGWVFSEFDVPVKLQTVSRKVRIPASEFVNAKEAIRIQDGNIHAIEGSFDSGTGVVTTELRFYQFEGGDIKPVNADTYECEYSWTYDKGTKSSEIPADSAEARFPRSLAGFGGTFGWTRPPFHQVKVFRGATSSDNPTFKAIPTNTYDPDGWKRLPGVLNRSPRRRVLGRLR